MAVLRAAALLFSVLLLFSVGPRPTTADAPFTPSVKVNDDGAIAWHVNPSLATDGTDNLYVAWSDNRTGRWHVYASRSIDDGATWSPNAMIDDGTGRFLEYYWEPPVLAMDPKGILHAVWGDSRNGYSDIFTSKSTDGGATWSTNVRMNSDSGTDHALPSFAVDARGNLYAAWATLHDPSWDIYAASSLDGGRSWSRSVRVNDAPPCSPQQYQCAPSLVAEANGTLHVVWNDFRNGHWDVYSSRSIDCGTTWSPNVKVNDGPGISQMLQWFFHPTLAADRNGNLYAAWEDWRSAVDVYSSRSTDGGTTWSPNVKVDDRPGASDEWYVPSIAVDDAGAVYAAWQDFRNGEPDLYMAKSLDGGASWFSNLRVNDVYGGVAGAQGDDRPLAATGVGNVYVAWADSRNGTGSPPNELDIHFSRWSAGPPGSASPTVAITNPADGQIMAPALLNVTGVSTNASLVQVRVDNGDWFDATGVDSWSWPLDLRSLADGNHLIEARAFNGTVASPHAIVTFTLLRLPDYVPLAPQPASPLTVGLSQVISLSLAVENLGDAAPAGNATLSFLNESSPPFASFGFPPVEPNRYSAVFATRWQAPAVPGTHRVIADVNYGNTVAESNETNNEYVWTIRVVAGPTTTLVIGIPNYTAAQTYIRSSTNLTFDILDRSGLGISRTRYRVNNGTWIDDTPLWPFALGANGVRYLEWYSIDDVGNVEPVRSAVFVVDDAPPVTTILPATGTLTPGTVFRLAATDNASGVARTEYRVDGGPWTSYEGGFSLSAGSHTIGYRSVDHLNNTEGERTLAVTVETPETNWKPLVAAMFAAVLALAGAWASRRRPWKAGSGRRAVLAAFAFSSLPFVIAEVATGVMTWLTGLLSIPPVLGVGTAVDVAILAAGLVAAVLRMRGGNSTQAPEESAGR